MSFGGTPASRLSFRSEVACPRPGSLVLCYIVTGKIGELRLPPVTVAGRADELWRHTCFEAFVQIGSRLSAPRQLGAVLYRDRQDRRAALTAGHGGRAGR